MKVIIELMVNWLISEVYQGQVNRAERFPKNVPIHEQVSNIKRFNLLSQK